MLPWGTVCLAKKDNIYVQMMCSVKTSIAMSFTQSNLKAKNVYPPAIAIIFGRTF